jgi:regulator of sigma E protease
MCVIYVLAVAAVAFLIVVHEGGHYFVARWCGMRIERFSIGFGPAILKKTSKKTGTIFQIAPIPFGGFVEIRGMNIAEDIDPDDHQAYPNRPTWQRFVTIFAGPATNYLSAIVLAMLLFTCHGYDEARWYGVAQVTENAAAAGKLQPGDKIVEVNHVKLVIEPGSTLSTRVTASKGAPLTFSVERAGKLVDVVITPKLEKDKDGQDVWRIGVLPEVIPEAVDVGVLKAAELALTYPVDQTRRICAGLYGIVFGKEKADPGGPVRMVEEFSKAFSKGLPSGIEMLMALSVYLGLFNLLPIPALDGGRLVFLGYELVTRRRANPKIEAMVHMGGIMALGVVMILVLIVDVKRFF